MSDKAPDIIGNIERDDRRYLDSAERLAEHYYENSDDIRPTNLATRVKTAAILSSQYLSGSNRATIANLIRALLENVPGDKLDLTEIELQLKQFEEKERDLFDLFKEELQQIGSFDLYQNPEIIAALQRINQLIYDTLKAIIEGDARADALTSLDNLIDNTRNEEFSNAATSVLEKINEILRLIAKLKGVRLLYTHPDPDNDNLQSFNYPDTENRSDLVENPYDDIVWNNYTDKDLNVDYIIQETEDGCRLTFKLCFGDDEFGYLEYELEGEDVHPIIFAKSACMSAMVDTFLNTRLQIEIKKLIAEKKREILKEYDFREWPTICTELLKYLSKVIGKPLAFTCKKSPFEDKSYSVLVDNDHANEEADLFNFIRETLDQKGEMHDLEIDMGEGEIRIGSIVVSVNDETRRGIIQDALGFFESVIATREQIRGNMSSQYGAGVADRWLDGTIEEIPAKHNTVALYADIDDYSKTTKRLSAENKEVIIPKVLKRFFALSKLRFERKYNIIVDKFVGDEIIILIGPPYTKDGRDAFGNLEPDYVKHMEIAYDLQIELQKLLTEITNEVCVEEAYVDNDGNALLDLRFAYGCGIVEGDFIGIFGDPTTPGAGGDYTTIGHEMNHTARVADEADADEFLMPYESYLKYVELGGTKLVAIGEPYSIDAQGIGDTLVVKITKK